MREAGERKIRVSLTSDEWADVRAAVAFARIRCAASFAEDKEEMVVKYQRLSEQLEEQIISELRGHR